MKKTLLALCFVMAFTLTAHAESVSVGGKDIPFTVPAGYVLGKGEKYDDVRALLKRAMPPRATVHGLYVPSDVNEKYIADDDALLDRYLLLVSMEIPSKKELMQKDFNDLKATLIKQHGELFEGAIRKQANERVSRATGGAVRIGGLKSIGTFGLADNQISYMALMTQTVNAGNKQITIEQAIVCTFLYTQKQLLMVNQYQTITDPAQAEAFKDDALNVINSMGFPKSSGGMGFIIVLVLFVAAAAGGFFYYKKKKASGASAADVVQGGFADMRAGAEGLKAKIAASIPSKKEETAPESFAMKAEEPAQTEEPAKDEENS